jgi:hypothetical protein
LSLPAKGQVKRFFFGVPAGEVRKLTRISSLERPRGAILEAVNSRGRWRFCLLLFVFLAFPYKYLKIKVLLLNDELDLLFLMTGMGDLLL